MIGDKGRAISLAARQARAESRAADLALIIEELKASGADSPTDCG
jgi:hypothetical protein